MSCLWVVHEQVMSEWFLGEQIAGFTQSTLALNSFAHAPAHLGNKPSLHDQIMKRFSEAHSKMLRSSWKVHDWSTIKLRLNDSWAHEKLEPHIRHWYFILSCARKLKLSWANYERIMRGSWVGEPRTPQGIKTPWKDQDSPHDIIEYWKQMGGPHYCFPI